MHARASWSAESPPFCFSRHKSWHFVSFRPRTSDVAMHVFGVQVSSKYGTWYSERVILQFMCVGAWTDVTYLRYTVLMSSKKDETTVHCWDPALSVLVTLVSRNVFYVVSVLTATRQSSYLPPEKLSINTAFVALEVIRNYTQWIFTHNYTIYYIIVLNRQSFKEDDDENYNRVYLVSARMETPNICGPASSAFWSWLN